jgi:putative spermidine/putrescine transport system permease protein
MSLKKPNLSGMFLGVTVILIYVFLHLPTVFVVLASVSETSYLTFPPKTLTLKWYAKALAQEEYVRGFKYSMILAVVTVLIATGIGTLAGYAIVRYRFWGRDLINAFFLAPIIFPMLIIGIALLLFYTMLNVSGSFIGLVFGHVVITFPYVIRTVSASLYRFDEALEEAAMTLGANRFTTFFRITLPIIKPGLIAGGLFAFITSFDNVPVSIFLVGSKATTLPIVIFSYIEFGLDPSIAAVSTFLICLTGLTILIIEKWIGFSKWGV